VRRILVAISAAILLAACSKTPAPVAGGNTDWDLLGNSPEMQHHSDLDQINPSTVSRLGLAWQAEIPSQDGLVGNPLVKDGIVFQSGARGRIFANDVRTGKQLWTYAAKYTFDDRVQASWGGRYNRGLALASGLAIVATGDCRLIAVDQKTGKLAWEKAACDANEMYAITGAPRVGDGMVFIGNSCLDAGTGRGHVDAFDAATGEHKWRFYTVPRDPASPQGSKLYDMAAKTWGTHWYSKTKGCGSAWDAMVYDEKLERLYVGTGGPAPFSPSTRAKDAGDELFTNSVIALDAKTGQYLWHFAETPHDGWNYEAAVGLMVADLPMNGAVKRVVISVPKNGFAYVLDAHKGTFISGKNYTTVNWAKGLDKDGRPIYDPAAQYWRRPGGTALILPSNMGAHGWEALAFSPKDNLLYIPVEVMPTRAVFDITGIAGGLSMDFYAQGDGPDWTPHGELVAWDPVTQTERWRHRDPTPVNGGLLHAGNVVFQGTADGSFIAYDGSNGTKLWSAALGGVARGAASTVMVDGEQYIIVASGNANSSATSSYVSRYAVLPSARGPARLLAFKLDGKVALPAAVVPPPFPKPAVPRFSAKAVEHGKRVYEMSFCVDCHGLRGESARGAVPDLRLLPPPGVEALVQIVIGGALKSTGMPHFPDQTRANMEAIYAYLIDEGWNAYEAQEAADRAQKSN
jgi:PQQ-dependent dehydrogenase (methanol/ethanol family)